MQRLAALGAGGSARRLMIGTGLAILLAVGLAPTALAVAPKQDSAVGNGSLTIGSARARVSVNARSGPAGEDPRGTIRLDRENSHDVSGVADVTCLRVSGNTATVGGRLRTPIPVPGEPGEFYQNVLVWIVDNGTPGGDADRFNTGLNWGLPGIPLPSCSSFVGPAPVDRGNFTVRDAIP